MSKGRGDRNPFHPELRRHARLLPRTFVTPTTMKVFRAVTVIRKEKTPRDVEVVILPGGVQVRVTRPTTAAAVSPAVLWIHGGGYVLGEAAQDDALCGRFATELGVTVAAVDYRLAPDHPYPAALDDCYAALMWLADQSEVDPTRIAIAGASAGGGLAAALAQLAHDRGEVVLAAQVLLYPMLDDRTALRVDPGKRHRRVWNNASNRLGWKAYLGDADPQIAVPGRRAVLRGLPPAWIGVGSLDVLHDEAVSYAERLRAAGVPCELEVVTGAFHGFDAVAPKTALAQAFLASQLRSLRKAFVIG